MEYVDIIVSIINTHSQSKLRLIVILYTAITINTDLMIEKYLFDQVYIGQIDNSKILQ